MWSTDIPPIRERWISLSEGTAALYLCSHCIVEGKSFIQLVPGFSLHPFATNFSSPYCADVAGMVMKPPQALPKISPELKLRKRSVFRLLAWRTKAAVCQPSESLHERLVIFGVLLSHWSGNRSLCQSLPLQCMGRPMKYFSWLKMDQMFGIKETVA